MSETKHTPGPWSWGRDVDEAINVYFDDDGDGIPDAEVFASDAPDDNSEANARLIAAAPDLAEACRELIAAIDAGIQSRTLLECEGKPGSTMSRARAAIAKALGEWETIAEARGEE
jgi:hypothetical protein